MLQNAPVFTSFSVDDLEAAKTFYSETLGLNVKEIPQGLSVELAEGATCFIYLKPNHQPATFTVLNFRVENIEATIDELSTKGIKFEQYDFMETNSKGISHQEDHSIAWFSDPARNIHSIIEETK